MIAWDIRLHIWLLFGEQRNMEHHYLKAINATTRVFPVPNWRARQVRGVERGGGVQGIDDQQTEFVDSILSSSSLGKNRVVLTTCSTKFPNQNKFQNFEFVNT